MTEKKKLWGGRFKKELDADAKKFSYSLHIDGCLAPYDIQVNLAHAKALEKQNLITEDELSQLETFFESLQQKFIDNPASKEIFKSFRMFFYIFYNHLKMILLHHSLPSLF